MRLAGALALVAATVLAGCTSAPATSSSPSAKASLSPAASPIPSASPTAPASSSPTDQPFATTVSCTHPYNSSHGVGLVSYGGAIGVLDVSNGLKPFLLCWFSPAQGAAFEQAANRVVFWARNHLGAIDLGAGTVTMTDTLPATPWEGVFSHNGSLFAYRTGDDTTGMSTHVYHGGVDRVLYKQAGLGGHGGPNWGPLDRLEFSADDQYLLDFYEFRPTSGPDTLLVYQTGAILVASVPADSLRRLSVNQAEPGAWSPKGSALFYFVTPTGSTAGKVLWWEPSGALELAGGIDSWSWPVVKPQGSELYYNEWVSTGPNDQCGGLPHLFRIDLGNGRRSQVSVAVASHPVFVTPSFVWLNEEKPTQCGIGGESAPDGVILGYDLANGSTKQVDMSQTVPGVGASQPNSGWIVDVWL